MTYVSHPPGIRSLTTYRPDEEMTPRGLVLLNDGAFYYQAGNSSYAGVGAGFVSDDGKLRQRDIRTRNEFESVARGSDGTLWATSILDNPKSFSIWYGAIERIGPGYSRVVLLIPHRFGYAKQLLLGPDGAWWFALPDARTIGRFSHGHFSTIGQLGMMKPDEIVFDSHGVLYAAELGGSQIAKILPDGKAVWFSLLAADGRIGELASGTDGDVWFTERSANRVGRVTSAGRVEDFSAGSGVVVLDALAVSRDSVWFALYAGIGRLSLKTHALSVIRLPDQHSEPNALAISQSGDVWFTESISDWRCTSECAGIARLVP